MRTLSIDIETFSSVDLRKTTVYKYAEAEDFSILLFAYAFDDDPVQVIDLTQERLPRFLTEAITDPDVIKMAYNANFERVCLSRYLLWETIPGSAGTFLPPEQWRCTMVWASTLGLPRSLSEVGAVLGLPEDKQKMKEGKALIDYFCKPCKPTKTNKGRTRNFPAHALDRWLVFREYNQRDVETEREIRHILEQYPLPDEEWKAYWMDQRINDRGVMIDQQLMRCAIQMNYEHAAELTQEAKHLTGLANVNSVSQLKDWLGHEGSLDKKAIQQMRKDGNLDGDADRVLAIRQELGKTSVSKYEAMERGICSDGRVHGLFAFYGANRTGRWAGRQVQVQNLPQNHLEDLELAREIVKDGDRKGLQALFGNVPATLSELIRTAFIAEYGHTFCVADFSAIEARVVAWLAGEKWRIENFRQGGDIYCASASKMFHVPVEKHGVNAHLRQKGKIAELALGYGGGVGAMKSMGALDMGLQEDELQPIVDAWRESNPAIVALWWQIDRLARATIECCDNKWHNLNQKSYDPQRARDNERVMKTNYGAFSDYFNSGESYIAFRRTRKLLHIRLPSGRCLRYWMPKLEAEGWRENITYGGVDAGKWARVETYGPKLFENIVQATARDCLRDAMLRVAKKWPRIVMHIHDEMVVEVPKGQAEDALRDMLGVMASPIDWAPGLLLKGDGYICDFYRKE